MDCVDHEALVVNHSVKVSGNKHGGRRRAWYELRNPNGANGASVFQQGTFAPDSNNRSMGSIAMDKIGNIALGYSVSSSSVFPEIGYTGRVPTDPAGALQAENVIQFGGGSPTCNLHPWGDYRQSARVFGPHLSLCNGCPA